MAVSPKIKNRIIKLTLYTNMSAKGIISIVSEEVPVTIEDYCEVLEEYEKTTGKKVTKGNKYNEELIEISDDLLIKLCKEGWSNTKILNFLLDTGYVIPYIELQNRINKLYKDLNLGIRRTPKKKKQPRKCGISDEEILALFDKGVTFPDMAKYFEKIGKKITAQRLNMIIHEIYEKRGEKVPKRNKKVLEDKPKKTEYKKVGTDDYKKIFYLREKGLTYEQIANYLKENGYKISASSISKLCKAIYKEAGKEEPDVKRRTTSFINKRIFDLKEQGLTYKEIEEILKDDGIDISLNSISARGYSEYKRRNVHVRGSNSREKRIMLSNAITDNELEKLLKQNYSYRMLRELFKGRGIDVSYAYLQKRIRLLRANLNNETNNSNIDISTINEKRFNNVLLNLKETKAASDEQLKAIADYYGFEFKKEAGRINPYNVIELNDFER